MAMALLHTGTICELCMLIPNQGGYKPASLDVVNTDEDFVENGHLLPLSQTTQGMLLIESSSKMLFGNLSVDCVAPESLWLSHSLVESLSRTFEKSLEVHF